MLEREPVVSANAEPVRRLLPIRCAGFLVHGLRLPLRLAMGFPAAFAAAYAPSVFVVKRLHALAGPLTRVTVVKALLLTKPAPCRALGWLVVLVLATPFPGSGRHDVARRYLGTAHVAQNKPLGGLYAVDWTCSLFVPLPLFMGYPGPQRRLRSMDQKAGVPDFLGFFEGGVGPAHQALVGRCEVVHNHGSWQARFDRFHEGSLVEFQLMAMLVLENGVRHCATILAIAGIARQATAPCATDADAP